MKGKTWLAAGLLCVWLAGGSIRVEAVSAQAAILIEQSSGRVLWEQNADAVLPMASTTKIMTALCVLEHADLEENVVIEECMSGIEGSSMYLEVGEELTVEQLLMGLMLLPVLLRCLYLPQIVCVLNGLYLLREGICVYRERKVSKGLFVGAMALLVLLISFPGLEMFFWAMMGI